MALDNSLNEISPLYKLKRLKNLTMSFNKLKRLKPQIKNLTDLKALRLSFNKLEMLPLEIGTLKKLQDVDISNNRLETLPVTIENLNNLEFLDASSNKLKRLPDFSQTFKPKKINLRGNAISKSMQKHIKARHPNFYITF